MFITDSFNIGDDRFDLHLIISFFFTEKNKSSLSLFVYITPALLSLQLPFEAREDASNTKMD